MKCTLYALALHKRLLLLAQGCCLVSAVDVYAAPSDGGGAGSLSSCAPPKPLSGKPPHILHIVADDLGYNDMGYVNHLSITPHIDSLRACGTHLDQFYTFKMCGPSRGSMLTGRYPFHFGVYSNQDINNYGIPANFTYLPEILKKARGYATREAALRSCSTALGATTTH